MFSPVPTSPRCPLTDRSATAFRVTHLASKTLGCFEAKSVVTLDVKPWGKLFIHAFFWLQFITNGVFFFSLADDETDMAALEAAVRGIEKDGLVWGASKLVPVGFGIKKLQINLVVEDEKISLDELQEQIQDFEDWVQSSDIAAMQKL